MLVPPFGVGLGPLGFGFSTAGSPSAFVQSFSGSIRFSATRLFVSALFAALAIAVWLISCRVGDRNMCDFGTAGVLSASVLPPYASHGSSSSCI